MNGKTRYGGPKPNVSLLAKEDLKNREEGYRFLLEIMNEGFGIVDENLVLTYANKKICEMLGYEPHELVGRPMSQFLEPENKKVLEGQFGRRKKGEVGSYEITWRSKNGKKIHTIVSPKPILDEDGNFKGSYSVLTDMTQLKRIEEEKKKLEAQLQRAQKMEAIGVLAGGVAHDLNNVLSGLVSYPEVLLMDLPEDSPLRKPLLTIQRSGQKAAAIVQDLLTLARRGVSVTEVVNLNTIISDFLKSIGYRKLVSFHPDVRVETNLETHILNILGSTDHLFKTIMNLVSNSAEAMPEGGTILISTENRYVERPISGYDHVEEGDYVAMSVSDTGVGISPGDRERIFEPFYTKKVMGKSGTGLGMAVVWGTVKDHHGYIDIRSTEGKGTTFTLYFPVTRKELDEQTAPPSGEHYRSKGESILVVDDVEEQREIASKMLEKLGYKVAVVSSGEEALEYMKNKKADLLLLDMIMDPGMEGLETYKRILKLHPGQKALIASGFSETERVREAQRLGAGAYIKKPYVLERIGLAVRAELEK